MALIGYLSDFSPGSEVTRGRDAFRKQLSGVRCPLVTRSDCRVSQDYESYTETFPYIEWRGLPKPRTGETPHHNAQKLFGFAH